LYSLDVTINNNGNNNNNNSNNSNNNGNSSYKCCIQYTFGKNKDFKEAVVQVDGKPVLRFAAAYGFRNIQSIVRRTQAKSKDTPSVLPELNQNIDYDFVEIMACPSGCTNGGAQIEHEGKEQENLEKVNHLYNSQPVQSNSEAVSLYSSWAKNDRLLAMELFHTNYSKVELVTHDHQPDQEKGGCKCAKTLKNKTIW